MGVFSPTTNHDSVRSSYKIMYLRLYLWGLVRSLRFETKKLLYLSIIQIFLEGFSSLRIIVTKALFLTYPVSIYRYVCKKAVHCSLYEYIGPPDLLGSVHPGLDQIG
jgi:hypothetical protein